MKKKISSIITAMFILFVCLFASACGDKYKDMEFKVYYSFSVEDPEWIDGTNGISLHYNSGSGSSPLVFDEYGGTIYIKVEINNVKAKHVDLITISPLSHEGLNFSSASVEEGEVVPIDITGNVNTKLNLYENNSGKKFELPFIVSSELTDLTVQENFKPAMPLTSGGAYGSLNLSGFNDHIVYHPVGLTNQKGVVYSVDSIGCYDNIGNYVENIYINKDDCVYIDEYNRLKVISNFLDVESYIVRIKATSVFHEDEFAFIDVYVVEGSIAQPVVKFNSDAGDIILDDYTEYKQINLYENGNLGSKDYSKSKIYINTTNLNSNYKEGLNANNGQILKYGIALYVKEENGNYKKYNLGDQSGNEEDGEVGVNGLYIEKGATETEFVLSIASRNGGNNTIKVAYEIEGLDFSYSAPIASFVEIPVVKGILPTGFIVNDTILLNGGDDREDYVYTTKAPGYNGLGLKIAANPNENSDREIVFEQNSNLIITNSEGNRVDRIKTDETIFVKFANGVPNKQELVIKTLNEPNIYNGESITPNKYVSIKYILSQVVTADTMQFVANEDGDPLLAENALINAEEVDNIYVKIYYTGNSLNTSTINLKSDNEEILFNVGDGVSSVSLAGFTACSTGSDADGQYDIYAIPMKASGKATYTLINIYAGHDSFIINESIRVDSVFVISGTASDINVDAYEETEVKEFVDLKNNSFNFAIAKGDTATFVVKDINNSSRGIKSISLTTKDLSAYAGLTQSNFGVDALRTGNFTNSTFNVYGRTEGKTQVLDLIVYYYIKEDGEVVLKSEEFVVQIAVFDPIANITSGLTKESIGYVNKFYTEISSTELLFESQTATSGTPANKVVFAASGFADEIEQYDASQLEVNINAYTTLLAEPVVINFDSINLMDNQSTILNLNGGYCLEGKIDIKLTGAVQALDNIKISLKAKNFGLETDVSSTVTIKIAPIDLAKDVRVDSGNFISTADGSKELRISFIDVEDGGSVEESFDVSLEFETLLAPQGSIRYDDISTALTYLLYEYVEDVNGELKEKRYEGEFFDVYLEDGRVGVRAYKRLGGGLFRMVFVTKDSYLLVDDPNEITLLEEHFDTTCAITIRVEDGDKTAFTIEEDEDLLLINKNLNKNFVLAADLGVGDDGPVNIEPIGKTREGLDEFIGTLDGRFWTILSDGAVKVSSYSITMIVSQVVNSTSADDDENGNLAGLFARVGVGGEIKNINLYVKYDFANLDSNNGLKVGSVAAVNKGTIENVNVAIRQNGTEIVIDGSNNKVEKHFIFGGIAGVNKNEIINSIVADSGITSKLFIRSNAAIEHNIGLVSGVNAENASIIGSYQGKESLNNFVYDVLANLYFENTINTGDSGTYYIGGTVGSNKGYVNNLLIGGYLFVNGTYNSSGCVGGAVGLSTGGSINLITAMSLGTASTLPNVDVGGIVGVASLTSIDTVKFVSVNAKDLVDNLIQPTGYVEGKNLVAGVAGKMTDSSLTYASVENFINDPNYYTIKGGTTTAGLVASISGTNVDNSFVSANITGTTIYLTTNETETDTYFIGKTNVSATANKTEYSVVDGVVYKGDAQQSIYLSSYMNVNNLIGANTKDWEGVYYKDGSNYVKASVYDDTKTYYSLDVDQWKSFVDGLVSGNFMSGEYYNVENIDGVDVFFPYILRSWDKDGNPLTTDDTMKEPLLIVKPESIKASVNQNYSIYIKEYKHEYESFEIKESVIVNFFDGAKDEENAHYLFNDGTNDGLLNFDLLPKDDDPNDNFLGGAQGGYAYKICGDGHDYAYINNKNQIVFIKESDNTPIIVKIYSIFDETKYVYVAFYSQFLSTELTLDSNSIYKVNEATHAYELNVYTGQNNKIISLGAHNIKNAERFADIFDNEKVVEYLHLEATSNKGDDSKLYIDSNIYNNIAIRIRELAEDEKIAKDENEIITFKLILSKDFFSLDMLENPVEEDVIIGIVKLKVNLYNAATSIRVDGNDLEITTSDDISLDVVLTTDYIGSKTTSVNIKDGEIFIEIDNGDDIKISLNIIDGETEIATLINNANKLLPEDKQISSFAELFNIQVIADYYRPENETKNLGYTYDILLEFKDDHVYRYINNNIKFNIEICATSNPEVNNKNSLVEILVKPASLTTARIENYVVKKLDLQTNYTNIVKCEDIETSVIEPGSLGNVMMIYLEPSYSQVTSASIKTSSLRVPSLGKNVQMKFTQLALDYRTSSSGVFSTLTSADANTQVGDTLELELISEIDAQGRRIYTGVVLIYIQLEKFSGLEATMTVELNVKTKTNPEGFTRTRDLLTSYLPGTSLSYNEDREIDGGYLIQKGTSNNVVSIEVYGYQFNSNPGATFAWDLPDGSDYEYVDDNKTKIRLKEGSTTEYLVGNYVTYYLNTNYNEIAYNKDNDSYSLTLNLSVAEDIPAAFGLIVSLSLTTKDGQLNTSQDTLKFYPTDYIINSVNIKDLTSSGRKDIAINQTKALELEFITDSTNNDLTETIYNKLLEYAENASGEVETEKLYKLFSYYKNGGTIKFSDTNLISEFEVDFVNHKTISITGVERFDRYVSFEISYIYTKGKNGIYEFNFGANGRNSKILSTSFNLYIYPADKQSEILVYSADDIYNSSTGTWDLIEGGNYVLVNDITLENVVPITTKIGSLDGNNRVISIKSFMVNTTASEYGLFANIGTYTVEDTDAKTSTTYQTILKNVVVDYSQFNGTLALNENVSSTIYFGGLVAKNNGGLIYNCDVINLDASKDVVIDVVVPSVTSVVAGGLVGENSGIITNSRVGRDGFTKISANKTTESVVKQSTGGLTLAMFNRQSGDDKTNQFMSTVAGFVGVNNGTIASSYVSKTNVINYSTNEKTNITSGFVGVNSGTISYSYAKADDKTITSVNPYSTGYKISSKGNGIVSGFVYNNSGTISNAYSNLELETKSAYIAGFVYHNQSSGVITESYAATTMNSGISSSAEQPFVGVNEKGVLLSNGTLENTYFLLRSSTDDPYKIYEDVGQDLPQGLNDENFQIGEHLIGFSFVLSNSKTEREQGVWSYYTLDNKKRILPELMNANIISHSYRYVETILPTTEEETETKVLRNAVSYAEGTANNPYIISNAKEFNDVFTSYGTDNKFVGYVRFINNINFNDDKTAISTRTSYTLGTNSTIRTSIEGNGMTISGIYLDVGEAVVEKIGLFAEIKNSYVKNLNLKFATPTTGGQFSTTTATYSGGLAGTIHGSSIINITLNGNNTTLIGENFVGGVAGLISGNSLIYGIETNLNVKATINESYLYYSEQDYLNLGIRSTTGYDYNNYIKRLSYAGGVAGVMDLTKRSNIEFNVQYIDVRGDLMSMKTVNGKEEANILAEYAGGVAGYASKQTESFKLRYFTGTSESIQGDCVVGGLFGVYLGGITASQVTSNDDSQFAIDTAFGDYIIALRDDKDNAKIDNTKIGNKSLLKGEKIVGGLIGVSLNAHIKASYSKASISAGEIIGGLVGVSVAGITNYSYAVPYINLNSNMKQVGGLIGAAYGVMAVSPTRNDAIKEYETIVKYNGTNSQNTDIQFTFSTLILDDNKASAATLDYVCANYFDGSKKYIESNQNENLMYVYAGVVNYSNEYNTLQNQTETSNKSSKVALATLYDVEDSAQVITFQEVFSGWALIKYWSLNASKYFPLLNNKTVDNYIEINDENDLHLIRNNQKGSFKVTKDFEIDASSLGNWVVEARFEGVLIGELEVDDRRPTITIKGLKPSLSNESTGFFKETYNATISNIAFEWKNATAVADTGAINLSSVNSVTKVGGLTCKDEGSLISNIEVRVVGSEYLINNTNTEIGELGGVIGEATNTNVLGCSFIGKVNAKLKDVTSEGGIYVGGIIGNSISKENTNPDADIKVSDEEIKSTVITNAVVGASKRTSDEFSSTVNYPITEFNLVVEAKSPVYVGGIVGRAEDSAISACDVGGVGNEEDYKQVKIKVNLNDQLFDKIIYLGGLVGYQKNGMLSNSDAVSEISVEGSKNSDLINPKGEIKVGGLAGEYSSSLSSTSGISNCNTLANINTGELNTADCNYAVLLSTGIAELALDSTLKQCLFTGEIVTESSSITTLLVGGAVARINSTSRISLQEVTTDSALYVGTESTDNLYVGGLIAQMNKGDISSSSSLGRIVPITNINPTNLYVGGLIGLITEDDNNKPYGKTIVNNSYTLSSIVADSIANSALSNLNMGALVGAIPSKDTQNNVLFSEVYYSSDYALFADENYLKNESGEFPSGNKIPLGTNISAQTMLNEKVWQNGLCYNGVANGVWLMFDINGQERMPLVLSLRDSMISYGLLSATNYDYVEGSAIRPKQIETGFNLTTDKYTYYLLVNNNLTVNLHGSLNGILIGQDKEFENTFRVDTLQQKNNNYGIIPVVEKHSAISNLHIVIENEISGFNNTTGIIAGINEGVIFNSSVQGTKVEISGYGSFGLIAGLNRGLISYSFSTAEVIKTNVSIGGIVNTNEGKLLSNYFTGYIEEKVSAGIVFSNSGYVYNNYMAGVIKEIGNNAFSNSNINGENNFIDWYSDVAYSNKIYDSDEQKENAHKILKPVETAKLMAGDNLTGEWHKTVINGAFDLNSHTFGYNYNYPVYQFNKQVVNGNTLSSANDKKHQLYTGTGGTSEDVKKDDSNLEDRYDELENPSENNKLYYHAFKIPHLGVLSAVHNLLGDSRNYVLVYDIDNKISASKNGVWKSIGQNLTNNGFKYSSGFKGVLVSNKYYDYNAESYCFITNIKEEGLFADIDQAYIGSIKLGNFTNLKDSGALGKNTSGTSGEGANVVIDNITFVEDSIISGENGSYYGGLFGEVTTNLTIKKFVSSKSDFTPLVRLQSQSMNLTAGLIAGKLISGTIKLEKIIDVLGKDISSYCASFSGNEYAGGLVGELNEGTININGNTIRLRSNINSDEFTGTLGGIVGIGSGTIIGDVVVYLIKPGDASSTLQYQADSFGGAFGEVTNKVEIQNNFTLQTIVPTLEFKISSSSNNYYGLIAGKQNGLIKLNKFEIKGINEINFIDGNATSESAQTNGIGLFVGAKIESDLIISNFVNDQEITISAVNISNVGGYIGYVEDVDSAQVNKFYIPNGTTLKKINIDARINAGGLFGYLKGNISENEFATTTDGGDIIEGLNFVNNSTQFACVDVVYDGSKNIGGLFGRWDGSNEKIDGGYIAVENKNMIKFAAVSFEDNKTPAFSVYNVGGIAGYINSDSIGELTNSGNINNSFVDVGINLISNAKEDSGRLYKVNQAVNVGGVVGLFETNSSATITQAINLTEITGYQNVGGIVGYVTGDVTIINSKSIALNEKSKDESGNITYHKLAWDNTNDKVDDSKATLATETNLINSGSIYGVINVGGAVGYAGNNVKISQIYSKANVYGNVNIGGLVGFGYCATVENNYLEECSVKGIYYNYYYENDDGIVYNSFIPTSVGGLAGTITSGLAEGQDSTLNNNILNKIKVSSTDEGEKGAVINTIRNSMVAVKAGSNDSISDFTSSTTLKQINEYSVVEFSNIRSGFGGFVGTINTYSIDNASGTANYDNGNDEPDNIATGYLINSNAMVNIVVEAQLGVNVGTYYGAYIYEEELFMLNSGEKHSITVDVPTVYGDISVSGAYNVGGIVGYVYGVKTAFSAPPAINNINNKNLKGSANIKLQSGFTGMYVGGLVGKTNSNTVSNLNLSASGDVKITIYTDNDYYVGGLIGRAEVDGNATINGNLGDWKEMPEGKLYLQEDSSDEVVATENGTEDEVYNFGALIGMLKVAKTLSPLTIEVDGNHKKPFTINTIENGNYHDGTPTFRAVKDEDSGEIRVVMMAYYVNRDNFKIAPSQSGQYSKNPFDGTNIGWAKDYTVFKTIQRNIPADENNGAGWDSLAKIYDAEYIRNVETGDNPKTDDVVETSYIESTIYEEEPGKPRLYHADYIAIPLTDENENWITEKDFDKNGSMDKALQRLGYEKYNKGDLQPGESYRNYFREDLLKNKIIEVRYENSDIYMLKEIDYNALNGVPAKSGSIFDAAGKTPERPQYGDEDVPITNRTWFKIAKIILEVGLAVVLGFMTGGVSAVTKFAKFMVFVAKVARAATLLMAVADMWSFAMAGYADADQTFGLIEGQSSGYLSSVYTREIYYEDGILKEQSDDVITYEDETYQPYSFVRPQDYSSGRYLLEELEGYNDSSIKVKDANLVNKTYSEMIGVDIKIMQASQIKDGKTITFNWKLATIDGKDYMVHEKYIYLNGMYYINTVANTGTFIPAVNDFLYDFMEDIVDNIDYLYKETAGGNYVYGKWNSSSDQYEYLSHSGNHLKLDGNNFVIKYGTDYTYDIDDLKATANKTLYFEYVVDQNKTLSGHVGYDYIQGVYYAPVYKGILDGSDKAVVKYAKFVRDNNATLTDLTQGIDYFYSDTEFHRDNNGEYVKKDDGSYVLRLSLTQEELNGLSDKNRYSRDIYVISNEKFQDSAFTESDGVKSVAVYPYSFTNPYKISLTKSNIWFEDKFGIVQGTAARGSLTNNAEYYLFVGGYEVDDEENVYTLINPTSVVLYNGSTFEESDKMISDGYLYTKSGNVWAQSGEVKNWNGYKDWYLGYEDKKFTDLYRIDESGEKVYSKNSIYKIADDGTLTRFSSQYRIYDENSFKYNKYLSIDKYDVNLFTRFKYGTITDFTQIVRYENDKWASLYYDGTGFPNGGRRTFMVESVKVSLCGVDSSNKIYLGTTQNSWDGETSGSITVLQK